MISILPVLFFFLLACFLSLRLHLNEAENAIQDCDWLLLFFSTDEELCMHVSIYFQWDSMQFSWDQLTAAHITRQLLTTSFNDQHECKHSELHVKHSGWGHVDYMRASRHTTPPGPGLKTQTAFYKFSDIRCQCSKTSELLREKEKEKERQRYK